MTKRGFSKVLRLLLWASWLGAVPAHGLDMHLQELPPAPGLTPSEPLDPLAGMQEALNCGLDALNTAKRCGLSTPQEAASPFLVRFDPLFCRLTMRFAIGELIDGLLKTWIAGAFARVGSPVIGALCLLGIGPHYCGSTDTPAFPTRSIIPQGAVQWKASAPITARQKPLDETPPPADTTTTESRSPETNRHDATGLDSLTR